MNTTGTRPHRLDGDLRDYQFRLAAEDLEAMRAVAAARGWSLAEAMRRAVALFLRRDMDNGPYTISTETPVIDETAYDHSPAAGEQVA